MKLNLRGHEDRYAIEQSLLAFFPEERPVYEGEDGDSHAEVTLHEGNVYATGVTTLTYGGKTARGEARVRTAGVSDAYERERLRQRALKLSFFRAARDVTGVTPSWGALTGIRPAKLVRTMLEDGMTPAQADRVLRDTYCVSPARRRLALARAEAVSRRSSFAVCAALLLAGIILTFFRRAGLWPLGTAAYLTLRLLTLAKRTGE